MWCPVYMQYSRAYSTTEVLFQKRCVTRYDFETWDIRSIFGFKHLILLFEESDDFGKVLVLNSASSYGIASILFFMCFDSF